jgi:hypothetical protein
MDREDGYFFEVLVIRSISKELKRFVEIPSILRVVKWTTLKIVQLRRNELKF